LLGSINTVLGTATFRGNEFQIEQGVLTFTDRQRIRPSFDLQASAQVKEYKVRLHAFGTPGEPHLSLSSDPMLAEGDLGFLLTFGFVSTNLQHSTFSAADSGLAIGNRGAQRATGFSAEVRRFIPKNPILRDPSIDFASEFSSDNQPAGADGPVPVGAAQRSARLAHHAGPEDAPVPRRGRLSALGLDLARFQLDNEHSTTGTGTDFGLDLHLKWEGD